MSTPTHGLILLAMALGIPTARPRLAPVAVRQRPAAPRVRHPVQSRTAMRRAWGAIRVRLGARPWTVPA